MHRDAKNDRESVTTCHSIQGAYSAHGPTKSRPPAVNLLSRPEFLTTRGMAPENVNGLHKVGPAAVSTHFFENHWETNALFEGGKICELGTLGRKRPQHKQFQDFPHQLPEEDEIQNYKQG